MSVARFLQSALALPEVLISYHIGLLKNVNIYYGYPLMDYNYNYFSGEKSFARGWKTSSICTVKMTMPTVYVVSASPVAASIVFYHLLLSGDVELNPGPTIFHGKGFIQCHRDWS